MTKGSSPSLLLEEVCILLGDLGEISTIAETVQSCSFLEEMNYALSWYIFDVKSSANNLAAIGSALSAQEGKHKMLSEFIRLSEKSSSTANEGNLVLIDLEHHHKAFDLKLTATFDAYRDVLETNSALTLLFHEARRYWNLATSNIEQAKDIRNGGSKV